MNEKQTTRASKFLSYVLRHQPEEAGLSLDEAGWVSVDELLTGCDRADRKLTREQLDHVVATNAKKRFEFNTEGTAIRASQGHSIEVELEYEATTPPEILYHGTASRFLDSISREGLKKMNRHHVHLSAETEVTMQVGSRHGKPVLLVIQALEMQTAGHTFYLSANGVWLTDHVPVEFIGFPE